MTSNRVLFLNCRFLRYPNFNSLCLIYGIKLQARIYFVKLPKYAVARGYKIGIYDTWKECEEQVKGFSKAKYKKSDSLTEAEDFIKNNKDISDLKNAISSEPLLRNLHTPTPDPNTELYIKGDDGFITVYTDGACSKNGKLGAKAGIGVWFNKHHPLNVSEPVKGYATNNNAEIQAATKAILQALKADITKLNIHTDSQFMIQCITSWIHKWKQNNWILSDGGHVKNKTELILLDEAIQKMECVKWTYVKGHSGDVGNSEADALARKGAEMY